MRVLYGEEMMTTFEKKSKERRQQGWSASMRFCLVELTRALPDAAVVPNSEMWAINSLRSRPGVKTGELIRRLTDAGGSGDDIPEPKTLVAVIDAA